MTQTVYKTPGEIYNALRKGKRLTKVNGNYNYVEDDAKVTRILYYYCTPQMNREMAKLEDGRCVDEPITIVDAIHNQYVEYQEPKDPIVELLETLTELSKTPPISRTFTNIVLKLLKEVTDKYGNDFSKLKITKE